MTSRRVCKAEESSADIISTLPQTILETILCLLPTEEAARTSILAKEWRYKWTYIPKLDFYLPVASEKVTKEKHVQGKGMYMRPKLFYGLHQILLEHKGPIHELTLDVNPWKDNLDPAGFDQIILYLSKNHAIKKFTFNGGDVPFSYNLPMSIFSLHHLTDLYLSCVYLDHPPIFNGFSCLRSLVLVQVGISTKTLLHLLSDCPSLKSLTIFGDHVQVVGKHCTVVELFECLPVIEHLDTCTDLFRWLVLDSASKKLPTSLFHFKYFSTEEICFHDGYGLAFLLVLIKCSPNLEKIKLKIMWGHECYGKYSVVWGNYSDVWLEHLTELEIDNFNNSKPEMEFVKFVLARSPKLKKVKLNCLKRLNLKCLEVVEERLKMLQVLLQAPRASPVEIYV